MMLIVIFSSMVSHKEYEILIMKRLVSKQNLFKNKKILLYLMQCVCPSLSVKPINIEMQRKDKTVLQKQTLHAIKELYGRPNGTGHIFVYDANGMVLSYPTQRQNIGKNLYATTDTYGRVMVIRDLIDFSQ